MLERMLMDDYGIIVFLIFAVCAAMVVILIIYNLVVFIAEKIRWRRMDNARHMSYIVRKVNPFDLKLNEDGRIEIDGKNK